MMNIIRKSSLVVMLVTLLTSCNDNDNLVVDSNANLINAKIEFKAAKGLDIEVIGTSEAKDASYEWEVVDESDPKPYRYQSSNNEGKTSLHWGPRLGVTKFTLIITSNKYPEPIKVTKEFTRTQKQIDDHNK